MLWLVVRESFFADAVWLVEMCVWALFVSALLLLADPNTSAL